MTTCSWLGTETSTKSGGLTQFLGLKLPILEKNNAVMECFPQESKTPTFDCECT